MEETTLYVTPLTSKIALPEGEEQPSTLVEKSMYEKAVEAINEPVVSSTVSTDNASGASERDGSRRTTSKHAAASGQRSSEKKKASTLKCLLKKHSSKHREEDPPHHQIQHSSHKSVTESLHEQSSVHSCSLKSPPLTGSGAHYAPFSQEALLEKNMNNEICAIM